MAHYKTAPRQPLPSTPLCPANTGRLSRAVAFGINVETVSELEILDSLLKKKQQDVKELVRLSCSHLLHPQAEYGIKSHLDLRLLLSYNSLSTPVSMGVFRT